MKRIPRVKEQSHDKAGVYGGGSRYGYLSTPKTSPSAGRMKHTQGTHTKAINVAHQLYGWIVAMRWRDTSKAQCKQAQDCSIYRCTKDKLGLSISPLDIALCFTFFFVQLFSFHYVSLFASFLLSLFFDFLIYDTLLLVTRPTKIAKHQQPNEQPVER